MTVTERARRSDALFYDNMSRRELCDAITIREEAIRLRDERYHELEQVVRELYGIADELCERVNGAVTCRECGHYEDGGECAMAGMRAKLAFLRVME